MDRNDKPEGEDEPRAAPEQRADSKDTNPDPGSTEPAEDVDSDSDENADDGDDADAVDQDADDEDANAADDDDAPDLKDRVLCPDGACIGVIGADGRCKVCGAAASPDGGAARPLGSARPDAPEPEGAAEDDGGVARPATDDAGDDELDLASRKLCSDGACIGVIGADGRCKICHKPYTGDAD